ncbi:hypothetical protein [Jatrophihabitans sp.]|uniref:hypothetical protein n=1 Tax=Jatrophihabitans sp. TaxID=1932789 RepID=UPI0030C723B4|nr:hypothetical protein [Jatrophihabitans sp.]
MDDALHRIEALPGEGRYSVCFRAAGGAEQAAVAQLTGERLEVAAASLPAGWEQGTDAFDLLVEAVRALDRARRASAPPVALLDVEGGWDVMIGNVVLQSGIVTCAAHGAMQPTGEIWSCAECGARATFAGN